MKLGHSALSEAMRAPICAKLYSKHWTIKKLCHQNVMLQSFSPIILGASVVFIYQVSQAVVAKRPSTATFLKIIAPFVAIPSLLQIPFSQIYDFLSRDPELVIHHYEIWRVVTATFVQSSGLIGTLVNLAMLAMVAHFADKVWGWRWSLAFFLTAGTLLNISGVIFDSAGAGSSGATIALGMSIVGAYLVQRLPRQALAAALAALAIAVFLSLIGNAHGYAMLAGTAIGAIFYRYSKLETLDITHGHSRDNN